MNEHTIEKTPEIVIAGAGYAGLHIALRLTSRLKASQANITLIDKLDYHQFLTELPRVAAGTRPADEVRVPLENVLDERVTFVHSPIIGWDFDAKVVKTEEREVPYSRLILALGSRPNDFGIPGLREHALSLWSVEDAKKILAAVDKRIADAGLEKDAAERQRLLTVAIGGAGATGVELAGELAEVLPHLMQRHDLAGENCHIVLVEGTKTVMPGMSQGLVEKADRTLRDLGVQIKTESFIGEVTADGFHLKNGETVRAGVMVWTGGVKTPDLVSQSGLPTGPGGRVAVDEYLRVQDRPEIYVAGDCALVLPEGASRPLPPTAQIAIEEGETVAANVAEDITGGKLETFEFKSKGFVISVGGRSGVADVAGLTVAGRPAMMLKNAIEWEYRQSVKHLKGWSPIHST